MRTPMPDPAAPPLQVTSAALSDAGPVRSVNEDACLDAADVGLWVVADGMGGHEGGQLASRMVIDCLDSDPDRSSQEAFVTDVYGRLQEANRRIQAVSRDRFEGRSIGSTVAVLLIFGSRAICLWAGDSRCYLLRDNLLRQVSDDHSHVAELVRQGALPPEMASAHPLRNVITRAVGARESLQLDRCDIDLRAGDTLLLCTDGLNKVLSDDEILAILGHGSCGRVADALIAAALGRVVTDNVTVCVVRLAAADAGGCGAEDDDDDPTIPFDRIARPR